MNIEDFKKNYKFYNAPEIVAINRSKPNNCFGYDVFHLYEIYFLDKNNKPQTFIGVIILDCRSESILESKSLKMFFNDFHNKQFADAHSFISHVSNVLNEKSSFTTEFRLLKELPTFDAQKYFCIDDANIDIPDHNSIDKSILATNNNHVNHEFLSSNLLRSCCPLTNQSDYGSLFIEYSGKQINKESLLKYIISYHNKQEFHEECVEQIFADILNICAPEHLTVEAKYLRRGGIDINPSRSTKTYLPTISKTSRQ